MADGGRSPAGAAGAVPVRRRRGEAPGGDGERIGSGTERASSGELNPTRSLRGGRDAPGVDPASGPRRCGRRRRSPGACRAVLSRGDDEHSPPGAADAVPAPGVTRRGPSGGDGGRIPAGAPSAGSGRGECGEDPLRGMPRCLLQVRRTAHVLVRSTSAPPRGASGEVASTGDGGRIPAGAGGAGAVGVRGGAGPGRGGWRGRRGVVPSARCRAVTRARRSALPGTGGGLC